MNVWLTLRRRLNIPVSTVSDINKNRTKILKKWESGEGAVKSSRRPKYEALDSAQLAQLTHQRANNVPINGPMLLQKAVEYAESLNIVALPTTLQRSLPVAEVRLSSDAATETESRSPDATVQSAVANYCCVCQNETTGAHRCSDCGLTVHVTCGKVTTNSK